jgi:flagellin-like protein
MLKKLRDRRGISPIFTTVTLILVVVLGMSTLFAFFIEYVKDFQLGQGSSILELIEVEDVWFKDNHLINITVFNLGKVDVKITSIYIDGEPAVFSDSGNNDSYIEIRVGELSSIGAQPPNPITNSTKYNFKLVTERGSLFESEYTSPSKRGW